MSESVTAALIGAGAAVVTQALVPALKHVFAVRDRRDDATAAALVEVTKQLSAQSERIGGLATELHGYQGTNGVKGEVRELRGAIQRLEDRINRCQAGGSCRP